MSVGIDNVEEKIKIATLETEIKHLKDEFEKFTTTTFCNTMGELKTKLDDFIKINTERPFCIEQKRECQAGFSGIYDEIERLDEKLSRKIRENKEFIDAKINQIREKREEDMKNYITKTHAFGYGLLTSIITVLLTVLAMKFYGG